MRRPTGAPFQNTYGSAHAAPRSLIRQHFDENSNRRPAPHSLNKGAKSGPLVIAIRTRAVLALKTDPAGFPRPLACYSCNTLPKRLSGTGDTSAFSLCRGFG